MRKSKLREAPKDAPAEVINFETYSDLRHRHGHTPAEALAILRTKFKPGDIVADRETGVSLKVSAVEVDEDGTCTLGFEGDMHGGKPVYDAIYYVPLKRN